MLRVSMPPKIDLPLESLFTNPAGEGFVAAVFPHVGDEVRGLAESLATNHALVRFLTRVDVGVLFHV